MKKNKKCLFFILFLLCCVLATYSQDNTGLSITVSPAFDLPAGSTSDYFSSGGGGGVFLDYVPPSRPFYTLKGHIGAKYLPFGKSSAVSLLYLGAGPGLNLPIGSFIVLRPYGTAGIYAGMVAGDTDYSETNFALKAGMEMVFPLGESLGLSLDGSYHYFHSFYHGIGLSAGLTFFPGKKKETPLPQQLLTPLGGSDGSLKIEEVRLEPVFPVFSTFYDTNPLGAARVTNNGTEALRDLRIDLFVESYMTAPKRCLQIEELGPGESRDIELFALFDERIMGVTEATKTAARIQTAYLDVELPIQEEFVETLRIYDRNAVTWDDDRKVASFITTKDPVILELSKNIASLIRAENTSGLNRNLLLAVALHSALRAAGLSYVIDPTTPFADFSETTDAVDFIQFPRQTLKYRAGDCDDLTILNAALLESLGIETAFITIPGHIYLAFSLDLPPQEAGKTFSRPEDFIFIDEKTWLPLEITMLQEDFSAAWQTGAEQWRENFARDQARLFPVHASWELYEPIGLPGEDYSFRAPAEVDVAEIFRQDIQKIISRELYPRISDLEKKIAAARSDTESGDLSADRTSARSSDHLARRYMNRLGILYARYGFYDKAEEAFLEAAGADPDSGEAQSGGTSDPGGEIYSPALLNLGNIQYLRENFTGALSTYERVHAQAPRDPTALLNLARAHYELQNYEESEDFFNKLRTINGDLADEYSYLAFRSADPRRASEISVQRKRVVWSEEENE